MPRTAGARASRAKAKGAAGSSASSQPLSSSGNDGSAALMVSTQQQPQQPASAMNIDVADVLRRSRALYAEQCELVRANDQRREQCRQKAADKAQDGSSGGEAAASTAGAGRGAPQAADDSSSLTQQRSVAAERSTEDAASEGSQPRTLRSSGKSGGAAADPPDSRSSRSSRSNKAQADRSSISSAPASGKSSSKSTQAITLGRNRPRQASSSSSRKRRRDGEIEELSWADEETPASTAHLSRDQLEQLELDKQLERKQQRLGSSHHRSPSAEDRNALNKGEIQARMGGVPPANTVAGQRFQQNRATKQLVAREATRSPSRESRKPKRAPAAASKPRQPRSVSTRQSDVWLSLAASVPKLLSAESRSPVRVSRRLEFSDQGQEISYTPPVVTEAAASRSSHVPAPQTQPANSFFPLDADEDDEEPQLNDSQHDEDHSQRNSSQSPLAASASAASLSLKRAKTGHGSSLAHAQFAGMESLVCASDSAPAMGDDEGDPFGFPAAAASKSVFSHAARSVVTSKLQLLSEPLLPAQSADEEKLGELAQEAVSQHGPEVVELSSDAVAVVSSLLKETQKSNLQLQLDVPALFTFVMEGCSHAKAAKKLEALAVLQLAKLHYALTSARIKHKTATALIKKVLTDNQRRPGCEALLQLSNNWLAYVLLVVVAHYELIGVSNVNDSFLKWQQMISGPEDQAAAGSSVPPRAHGASGSMLNKIKNFASSEIITAFKRKYALPLRWATLRQAWLSSSNSSSHFTSTDDWRAHLLLEQRKPAKRKQTPPPPPPRSPSPPLNAVKFSFIFVYTSMKRDVNDVWTVEVKRVEARSPRSSLFNPLFDIISCNRQLKLQLERDSRGKIVHKLPEFANNPAGTRSRGEKQQENMPVCHIGEYAAADLHTIYVFRQLVDRCPPGSSIAVVFVSSHSVDAEMRRLARLAGSEPNSAVPPKDHDSRFLLAPQRLLMPAGQFEADRQLTYSFADSWDEALTHARLDGHELRGVNVRTLMWFNSLATESERQRYMTQLIAEAGAGNVSGWQPQQYPPNAVNATYDDKAKNARMFEPFMPPQLWLAIEPRDRISEDRLDARLRAMAEKMLAFSKKHEADSFVLKGSMATCESTFAELTKEELQQHDGMGPLLDKLKEFVLELKQHCVGIQMFNKHLRTRETRVWVKNAAVRGSNERKLEVRFVVLTYPNPGMAMDADFPDSVGDEEQACMELVQRMIEHPPAHDFFRGICYDPEVELPFLRVDTYCDADSQRAWFNEFAPTPDAVIFTRTHESTILSNVGWHTAKRMWRVAQ